MKRPLEWLTLLAVLAMGAWYVFDGARQREQPPGEPALALPGDAQLVPPQPAPDAAATTAEAGAAPTPETAETSVAASAATAEYPLEETPSRVPLPPLADSDGDIRAALAELLPPEAFAESFQIEQIARKFVVSVDNLTAGRLPLQQRLLKPLGGTMLVVGDDEALTLDPANFSRYDALVARITALDATALVRLYRLFYPLLQEAYEALGYPGKYFNDRLVAVIDHLLEARPLELPVQLVQPKVAYRFADPSLEAASVGHKALYRIGPTHLATVQAWLRDVRAQLVRD